MNQPVAIMMRWIALALFTACKVEVVQGKDQIIQTFSIKEVFGVPHPDQIIDFDLQKPIDPRSSYMIGPDGKEVPYQLLEGGKKVAVETDLAVGTEKRWKLMKGRAPQKFSSGIEVSETKQYFQATNGLTGFRIPALGQKPAPAELLAPIQGVMLRDGRWTGTGNLDGPNLVKIKAVNINGMTVRVLEKGPLKVVAEISYLIDRPELLSPWKSGEVLCPAGEGFYRSTIEVQAGQPSILFEEDADTEASYSFNLYPGLEPTQARYRGHHTTTKEYGHDLDGKVPASGAVQDVFVDLAYDRAMEACYVATESTYCYMAVWNPWAVNSGWYWQIYNAGAPANANLVGIFAGRASSALGANNSGVGLFTRPDPKQAGLTIALNRLSPDARWFPRVRFQWRLFTGIKGEYLKPPAEAQPINVQLNLHGGINLNKIHRYELDFPDPPKGYGGTFMGEEAVQRMIKKLRTDSGFFSFCYHAESESRSLLDMWVDLSGKKTHETAEKAIQFARRFLNIKVNEEGIYHWHYNTWQSGQAMMQQAMEIDAILASDQATAQEKTSLKAILSAYGNMIWDNDLYPLCISHGLNVAQGAGQHMGMRQTYALLLAEQASFKSRSVEVEQMALDALPGIINEHGAGIACTHYMSPYVTSTLNLFLQLRILGKDHFKTEPRLAKFAESMMNFLTPPEPRFGGKNRYYIATGHGSTESSELYGVLATGFREANPDLSARLMGAWQQGGKVYDPRFGTCLLRIDEQAPAKDPQLGSANFPGYYSVLRHGWGTSNETAMWFINGDFYSGHRNEDHGMVVMYALGAPLSVGWTSYSYPQVEGSFGKGMITLEKQIGHPWDQDGASITTGGGWNRSTIDEFLSFGTAAHAKAHFDLDKMAWIRSIYSIHPDETHPILMIQDSFSGEEAAAGKIFTLPLMAQGEVDTPAGKMTPTVRTHPPIEKTEGPHQLPSAGKAFDLKPGLNRLGFTGQWLVDWDLYTISDEAQQAHVGNWGHTWAPAAQQNEFSRANQRPFEEHQHMLRIRGNKTFRVLIFPYRKGEKRDDCKITCEGTEIVIATKEGNTRIGDGFYSFQSPQKRILASFKDSPVEGEGIRITGGPLEVIVEGNQAIVMAHGTKGMRKCKLPGKWKVKKPMEAQGDQYALDYRDELPKSVILEKAD